MDDRSRNLKDFQERLSERLRQSGGAPQSARLGLQVGERRLLVDLAEAGEIVTVPTAIAPVPLTREWFRGLVNLRGSLHGVTDLAHFEGGEPAPATREARLVAFAARLNVNAALLVARMLGLQNLAAMTPAGEAAQPERPWLGARWLDAEGREWTELSFARLAADERFMAVAR